MSVGRPPDAATHLAAQDGPDDALGHAGTVVLLVAAVTAVVGLVNAAAALEQLHRFPDYARVDFLLACAELTWAAVIARHPAPELLALGLGFALLGLAAWADIEAVGVSGGFGSAKGLHAIFWCTATLGGTSVNGWHTVAAAIVQPLAYGAVALALASVLLASRMPLAQRLTERLVPVLLAVLGLGVLYGVGAH